MKPAPSFFKMLSIAGLCLAGATPLWADNIANWPDPTKHHHYANPDGNIAFSDPNNVMPGHYNYVTYYAGNDRYWQSDLGMDTAIGGTGMSQGHSGNIIITHNPDQSSSSSTPSPDQSGSSSPSTTPSPDHGSNPFITPSPDQSNSGGTGSSLSGQSSDSSSQLDQNQAPAPVNRASNLIGMTVKNTNNETLGTIKELVFNLQSGRVAYVVLQKADQSQGANNIAVPLAAFTPSADNSTLTLNVDRSKLQSARSFTAGELPSIGSQSYGAEPTVREHIIIVPVPSSHLNPGPSPDSDQDQDQPQPQHKPESSPDTDSGQSS